MNTNDNTCEAFSPAWREHVLDRTLSLLEADARIAGAIIVGSGAVGFEDKYSDIDLCVVIAEEHDAVAVFQSWRQIIEQSLPVIHCFEAVYGKGSYLWGFLLEGFLEMDVGFVDFDNLSARRPRWKIAFDRSGKIEAIMRSTSREISPPTIEKEYLRLVNSIWHFVIHVAVALERGQPLRALHYLEALRNRTVELAGLRLGLDTGHFRQVDEMPQDILSGLEPTLPLSIAAPEIMRALRAATECFFREAQALEANLGLEVGTKLNARMNECLKVFPSGNYT